eukprot:COSAG02_NODE_4427_length_5372_cov_4.047791_1_plen_62_part_10
MAAYYHTAVQRRTGGTCATLETGEILRSGFHGQIAKMTGTTHLTGVPDLKTSLISKPVTLET